MCRVCNQRYQAPITSIEWVVIIVEIDLTEPIDLYYKWTEALINLNEREANSDEDEDDREDDYGGGAAESEEDNEEED